MLLASLCGALGEGLFGDICSVDLRDSFAVLSTFSFRCYKKRDIVGYSGRMVSQAIRWLVDLWWSSKEVTPLLSPHNPFCQYTGGWHTLPPSSSSKPGPPVAHQPILVLDNILIGGFFSHSYHKLSVEPSLFCPSRPIQQHKTIVLVVLWKLQTEFLRRTLCLFCKINCWWLNEVFDLM